MGSVTVTIPGRPVPCPRPRVTGKRTYMPDSYLAWKTMASILIRDAVIKQRGGRLMEGDVGVEAHFFRPHGSSDGDNCFKAVLDASQGQIVANDRQVVEGHYRVHRGSGCSQGCDDKEPHTDVFFMTLESGTGLERK